MYAVYVYCMYNILYVYCNTLEADLGPLPHGVQVDASVDERGCQVPPSRLRNNKGTVHKEPRHMSAQYNTVSPGGEHRQAPYPGKPDLEGWGKKKEGP